MIPLKDIPVDTLIMVYESKGTEPFEKALNTFKGDLKKSYWMNTQDKEPPLEVLFKVVPMDMAEALYDTLKEESLYESLSPFCFKYMSNPCFETLYQLEKAIRMEYLVTPQAKHQVLYDAFHKRLYATFRQVHEYYYNYLTKYVVQELKEIVESLKNKKEASLEKLEPYLDAILTTDSKEFVERARSLGVLVKPFDPLVLVV